MKYLKKYINCLKYQQNILRNANQNKSKNLNSSENIIKELYNYNITDHSHDNYTINSIKDVFINTNNDTNASDDIITKNNQTLQTGN